MPKDIHFPLLVARVGRIAFVAGCIVVTLHGKVEVWPGPGLPSPTFKHSVNADGYRDDRTITIPGSAAALFVQETTKTSS